MFKMIDTDNSGQISFEELKDGLKRFGATLNESEIHDLMQAVSLLFFFLFFRYLSRVYFLGRGRDA